MPASSPSSLRDIRACSHASPPSACTCGTASPPSPGFRCRPRRRGFRDRSRCRRLRPTAWIAAAASDFLLQVLQRGLRFGDHAGIVLGFADFDQADSVVDSRSSLRTATESSSRPLLHQLLSLWGSFQRRGLRRLFSSSRRAADFPVKDASSAGRRLLDLFDWRSISGRMGSLICGPRAACPLFGRVFFRRTGSTSPKTLRGDGGCSGGRRKAQSPSRVFLARTGLPRSR